MIYNKIADEKTTGVFLRSAKTIGVHPLINKNKASKKIKICLLFYINVL